MHAEEIKINTDLSILDHVHSRYTTASNLKGYNLVCLLQCTTLGPSWEKLRWTRLGSSAVRATSRRTWSESCPRTRPSTSRADTGRKKPLQPTDPSINKLFYMQSVVTGAAGDLLHSERRTSIARQDRIRQHFGRGWCPALQTVDVSSLLFY